MRAAYRIDMTEHESGWGSRPDGCVYSLDRFDAIREADKLAQYRSIGVSVSRGNPYLVEITRELEDELVEKTVIVTPTKKHPGDLS